MMNYICVALPYAISSFPISGLINDFIPVPSRPIPTLGISRDLYKLSSTHLSLVTTVLLIVLTVELFHLTAPALCREGFAVITLKSISSPLTLCTPLHG